MGHGQGRGKMGPAGYCVCASCGYRKPHQPGVPCMEEKCPKCGKVMLREGSEHYLLALDKKKNKED